MIRTTTIPNSWFILKIWRTLHNIPIPKMPSAASPSDVRRTHQGQLVCKEQWWRQRNTQRRSHRIPRKSSMASTSQPQGSQKLDHWRLFQTGKAVTYSFEHHSTIFNFMLGMLLVLKPQWSAFVGDTFGMTFCQHQAIQTPQVTKCWGWSPARHCQPRGPRSGDKPPQNQQFGVLQNSSRPFKAQIDLVDLH